MMVLTLLLASSFQEDLARWVEQLGADDFASREAAEQHLRTRLSSETVRAQLGKVEEGSDPEKASRAKDILSWVRSASSPAGLELKLEAVAQSEGTVDLSVTLVHQGKDACHVSDPDYWNVWPFFSLQALAADGTILTLPIQSTRSEEGFRGMAQAKVPLGAGQRRRYTGGQVRGLMPGTYRFRMTARTMKGAKGYEGRAADDLIAPRGAMDTQLLTIPERNPK